MKGTLVPISEKQKTLKLLVTLPCSTLCDPVNCSLAGSSILGILRARILEWVAIPFSRESSLFRDRTEVSCIAGRLPSAKQKFYLQSRPLFSKAG